MTARRTQNLKAIAGTLLLVCLQAKLDSGAGAGLGIELRLAKHSLQEALTSWLEIWTPAEVQGKVHGLDPMGFLLQVTQPSLLRAGCVYRPLSEEQWEVR